ncbi:MAG TPA: AAA family ATPase [Cryomorphaceae bacterium]|nr:AAA family ATPase [Cryomorphaceae bacterium]
METSKSDITSIEKIVISFKDVKKEVSKVIIGQDLIINQLLMTVFSGGHSVLIGVPGLAKTLLVNSVAKTLGLKFNRIQFTPDLMPSDIVGSEILDENRNFKFIKGPLFSNIILADEINRTPPKTQSALLEAMQEKSVTAAGTTYRMDEPFFVLATQNPIEQEGTYPLPEAQLDRFMFNIEVGYPTFEEELQIVKSTTGDFNAQVSEVLTASEIIEFQKLIRKVPVSDTVYEYAVSLASATRPESNKAKDITREYIAWGAGPRASQYLILGAKAHAALHGKYSPDSEDVFAVAEPILRHRIVKNYKAEAEGIKIEQIIKELV